MLDPSTVRGGDFSEKVSQVGELILSGGKVAFAARIRWRQHPETYELLDPGNVSQ
jgi:hypothetical protein